MTLRYQWVGAMIVIACPAAAQHPPAIASISVCSPSGAGGQGSCPSGSLDTHQIVFGPNGSDVVNKSSLSVDPVPDEHSTVFAPGTLGNNQDYLFFLATSETGHPAIGMAVLSGGSGPNKNGQWSLDFPRADGYGSYPIRSGFGQVFNPSSSGAVCPAADDGNPARQDQTFDMHYAAGGSVVKDPTASPGALMMVYEGTNACVGNAGGKIVSNQNDYISLAIATSLDYGKSWPTYRGTPTFNFVRLPGFNATQAPNAPMGALGKNVCMGNDCSTTPPAAYGRYPVVTPPMSLASLMAEGKPLTSKVGEQEISGFVDDVAGNSTPYLYANWTNAKVARAQLNGGTAALTFEKWDGHAFTSPGIGGEEASVLPTGPFENCGAQAPVQNQYGSSISYVEDTEQYLLTFLCVSPSDPALGQSAGGNRGAAWFWSTSYDLSDQTKWTAPREINGSWSDFSPGACPDYKGYYPSFMSIGKSAGHLSLSGHVFYLWGCQGGGIPGGRKFSSRAFTIATDTTLPVTTATVFGTPGHDGWYVGPTVVNFAARDDLSGVLKTEFSLDNGTSWTTTTGNFSPMDGNYTILFRSTDFFGNVEIPKSISVKIDSTAPFTGVNTHYNKLKNGIPINFEVDFTASDNESGVAKTQYSLDNGSTWTRRTKAFFTTSGTYTILYHSTDVAGNVERRHSITVNVVIPSRGP